VVWVAEVYSDSPLVITLGREPVVELANVAAVRVGVGELLDGVVAVLAGNAADGGSL